MNEWTQEPAVGMGAPRRQGPCLSVLCGTPSAQDRAWHTEDSVNVVNKFKVFNICYGKSITGARVKSLVAGWWGDLTDPGEGLG